MPAHDDHGLTGGWGGRSVVVNLVRLPAVCRLPPPPLLATSPYLLSYLSSSPLPAPPPPVPATCPSGLHVSLLWKPNQPPSSLSPPPQLPVHPGSTSACCGSHLPPLLPPSQLLPVHPGSMSVCCGSRRSRCCRRRPCSAPPGFRTRPGARCTRHHSRPARESVEQLCETGCHRGGIVVEAPDVYTVSLALEERVWTVGM